MATFLMIHGAWHGGWVFDRLHAPLAARGHAMAAPTLPGMDGTAKGAAAATLEGWARFVVEAARALPGPVVLCGHSRAGIVISQAAERDPGACAALVYLCAFLLPNGQSMTAAVAELPRNERLEAGLSPAARGAALALSADAAIGTFYNDCSEADQTMAAARLVPEPMAPMATTLALSDTRFGAVPRHYIECTADRAIPIAFQRAMQAQLPCASVTTLASDHSPFLAMPDALAQALHSITERIER